jgi:triosephosphate isomerase
VVLTPLLSAAERLTWVPALAGGCLVDGRAAAALGDHAAAGALIGRAVTLAARHHMPVVEREARTRLAASHLQ